MIVVLIQASIAYLLLPVFIFFIGWLKTVFSVPLCLGLGVVYTSIFRRIEVFKAKVSIPHRIYIILGIIAFVWTLLSGAGHRGFFDGDYYKHNAILSDLIAYSWPVKYHVAGAQTIMPLVYYIAYYLPAAAVGLVGGWKMANSVLFLWTAGGVLLTFLWIAVLAQKKVVWAVFLFILFSGLDGIGRLILYKQTGMNPDWEWWAGQWQYSGVTTLLFYVPQHALAGWIAASMLLFQHEQKETIPGLVVAIAATVLWSPFVFVGLIPYVCYLIIRKISTYNWIDFVGGGIIVLITGLYITSSLFGKSGAGGVFLWQHVDVVHSYTLVRLLIFYVLEFGIYAFFIKKDPFSVLTIVLLILIPWYRLGLLNDFVMRVSIPALFVLFIYWIRAVMSAKARVQWLMIGIICIACLYPLVLLRNGIVHFSFGPPRYHLSTLDTPPVRMQYLGNGNSIFFRFFTTTRSPIMGVMQLQN